MLQLEQIVEGKKMIYKFNSLVAVWKISSWVDLVSKGLGKNEKKIEKMDFIKYFWKIIQELAGVFDIFEEI